MLYELSSTNSAMEAEYIVGLKKKTAPSFVKSFVFSCYVGSICSVFWAYMLLCVHSHSTDEIMGWIVAVLLESVLHDFFKCFIMQREF